MYLPSGLTCHVIETDIKNLSLSLGLSRSGVGVVSQSKRATICDDVILRYAKTEKRYGQSATTHHLVHVYGILKTLIWFHF